MTTTGLNLRFHHRLLLVSIILLILSPSHADDEGDDEEDETIIAWKKNRSQFNESNNSTFILAAQRTRRIDPTNHFQFYENGWNIVDSHYYASLLYSGFGPLYVAAIWFVGVVIFFLIALCCCCCCCNNKKDARSTSYSRAVYWGSLIYIVLFLLVAIVGAAVLYAGQENFGKASKGLIEDVGTRINDVLDLLNSVLNDLDGAMKLAVGAYALPDEYASNIDQFRNLVHSNSTDNPRIILDDAISQADQFLTSLSRSLVAATVLMLFLAILGLIFSVCGSRIIIYLLFFIGWILVTGTLIQSAFYLVVKNGVGDTCVAIEEWLEHPQYRTSLSEVLPCVDGTTAQKALDITRNTSFSMAKMVNDFVANIANIDPPPGAPPEASYNQSGPPLPLLCNPFNSDFTQRQCAPQEVPLDQAPQVYKGFVCKTSEDGGCSSVGRLTPDVYQQIMMAVNVSDALSENGPKLIDLLDCTFFAETFDDISAQYCLPMRRFSSFIFIGLLLLSFSLLFSLIFWLVFLREKHRQMSSHHFR